jgi:hypothetical protein
LIEEINNCDYIAAVIFQNTLIRSGKMPKEKKAGSVTEIFEQFTASLGALIKDKVAEAVQTATNDFFANKFSLTSDVKKAKAVKPAKKAKKAGKKRGRPKGSTNKAAKAAAVAAEKPATV